MWSACPYPGSGVKLPGGANCRVHVGGSAQVVQEGNATHGGCVYRRGKHAAPAYRVATPFGRRGASRGASRNPAILIDVLRGGHAVPTGECAAPVGCRESARGVARNHVSRPVCLRWLPPPPLTREVVLRAGALAAQMGRLAAHLRPRSALLHHPRPTWSEGHPWPWSPPPATCKRRKKTGQVATHRRQANGHRDAGGENLEWSRPRQQCPPRRQTQPGTHGPSEQRPT